jgi:hypothetical protein
VDLVGVGSAEEVTGAEAWAVEVREKETMATAEAAATEGWGASEAAVGSAAEVLEQVKVEATEMERAESSERVAQCPGQSDHMERRPIGSLCRRSNP